jgi:hypothetical protein
VDHRIAPRVASTAVVQPLDRRTQSRGGRVDRKMLAALALDDPGLRRAAALAKRAAGAPA